MCTLWNRSLLLSALLAASAMASAATPLESGSIEGRIVDAQGMLNINNLVPMDSSINADAERELVARG